MIISHLNYYNLSLPGLPELIFVRVPREYRVTSFDSDALIILPQIP